MKALIPSEFGVNWNKRRCRKVFQFKGQYWGIIGDRVYHYETGAPTEWSFGIDDVHFVERNFKRRMSFINESQLEEFVEEVKDAVGKNNYIPNGEASRT